MNILFTSAKAFHFGLLYNRPTVEDSRNLAPLNWEVAGLSDFQDLITFYGGEAIAGGELKASEAWTAPNSGAGENSAFKALPAGTRSAAGAFIGLLTKTVFWLK